MNGDKFHVIIDDTVDLFTTYGAVLTDDSVWNEPPEVQANYVDVPGRVDGPLDMTEALFGEPLYGQRTQTLVFYIDPYYTTFTFLQTIAKFKTLLHGKKVKFMLPFDENYTYTGRWNMTSWKADAFNSKKGTIEFSVTSEPYKYKKTLTFSMHRAKAIEFNLPSGMRPVCPIFEFARPTLVNFEGESYRLNAGTYRIDDLYLHEGDNTLFCDSALGDGDMIIGFKCLINDYKLNKVQVTKSWTITQLENDRAAWSDIKGSTQKEVYSNKTIKSLQDKRIAEYIWRDGSISASDSSYITYVQYEWSDI